MTPIAMDSPARSIIVVGVNRGGTSAVAASLNAAGVFVGERWHHPIYEDLALADAFRAKDWPRFRQTVAAYEAAHPLLGWKLPNIAKELDRVHGIFRRPSYVFVFRDLYAIGLRKQSALGTSLLAGMNSAQQMYRQALQFVERQSPHHLMVSYEKMLLNREDYASTLLRFLEIEPCEAKLTAIVQAITPSPLAYRQWADATQTQRQLSAAGFTGGVDRVTPTEVSGWVLRVDDDTPVSVEVRINGRPTAAVAADQPRPDLVANGISRSELHGFRLTLSPALRDDETVEVYVAGTSCRVSPPIASGSPRRTAASKV